jgi:ribosomal protein L24
VIGPDDVMTVQVSTDPALRPVPASAGVHGGRPAGRDRHRRRHPRDQEQVSDTVLPAVGMSIVGVGLPASQMPGEPLLVGDRVRVVATPGQSGEVTAGEQVTIAATVVGVRVNNENGQNVVSVQVPEQDAAELAARAATGNVALVLDSRER